MARPDHNAAGLDIKQSTYAVMVLKALRMMLKAMEETLRQLDYQGADVILALRHLEDARMRCGKAMAPFDTGFAQTDNPDENAVSSINSVITNVQAQEGEKTYPVLNA